MCISTIADEIAAVEWDIVPKDKDNVSPQTEKNIETVKSFFDNPNINKESFEAQIRKIVRDVLTIDAGVWVKVFSQDGFMREMYVRDGGTFTKNPDIFGTFNGKADIIPADFTRTFTNPNFYDNLGQPRQEHMTTLNQIAEKAAYFQYGWITGARPMPFGKREIVYLMRNPRPDSIYGRSPVEVALDVIQMLVYGIDHNLEYFEDNNIPKGIFKMIGADDDAVKEFTEKWKEATQKRNEVGQYRRRFYHMPVINQDGSFERISFSNAELELISQQQWFTKLIWALFGVTPSELGFTESSNRATEVVQSRVFRRKAIRPLLNLIEYHINTEIIPEFKKGVWLNAEEDEQFVKGINDVKFKFNMYDIAEDLEKHQLYQIQLRNKLKTPNEIREEIGLTPIEGGDSVINTNPFSQFAPKTNPNTPLNPEENKNPEEQKLEEKSIEMKPFGEYRNFDDCVRRNQDKKNPEAYCAVLEKKITGKYPSQKAMSDTPLILKPFEEIDTSKDMEKLLKKILSQQEKQIIEKLKLHTGKPAIEQIKSLNSMVIKEIKEIVNLNHLDESMRKLIEQAYFKALDEVGMDFNRNFLPDSDMLNFLEQHALENVKDLSEEIKSKIRKELEYGLYNGESIPKLKKRIKSVFEMANSRAEMIARTESNKAANAGAIDGYKKSGLKGKLKWVAHLDDRTCKNCKALNGKEVNLGESFSQNGVELKSPPFHPNCRCRVVFVPED